ncbi:MAG: hypothetical protein COB20_06205 [SAR86 cluster bacterium]|uniref:VWA domain-containing protein n=1 Tax=SAR86 cluster bacterium TaxID=2030880 RepID=A0A2A4X859_9GAMM|nr:hypothetical protein [Sneathiella sp.]PCI78793.1 MAG: hypothetical protein COB20_06205 [SAR86 cluster bacterium]
MGRDLDQNKKGTTSNDVDAFLKKVSSIQKVRDTPTAGRLIFAIDATASRQPTWDHASHLQREMFNAATIAGKLELQIAFFRGFGEFRATPWTQKSESLIAPMSRVSCLGGHTQIEKVLKHTLRQTKEKQVNGLVYIGDCMEEEADKLCHLAGQLGMQGVPVFAFQEGSDTTAETCFRQIAKLSGGAFCKFDMQSAEKLKLLLNAVAVYAAGGRKALLKYSQKVGGETLLLARQVK